MEIKKGIAAHEGVGIGEAFVLGHENYRVAKQRLTDLSPAALEAQWKRFEAAADAATAELKLARERLLERDERLTDVGNILSFQTMTLESNDLRRQIRSSIQNGFAPEFGVQTYFRRFREVFISNEVFSHQITDVDALERRLLRHLLGQTQESLKDLSRPVILVASDLDPATTAELPLDKVLAIVTDKGGATSHTAIVARSRNIPAVVGLRTITTSVNAGDLLIVDGGEGRVIVKPVEQTRVRFEKKREQFLDYSRGLERLRDLPSETQDGYSIRLHANIEYPGEVAAAVAHGAVGVGLYRTEFLCSETNPRPTEDEHFEAYCQALELLNADGVERSLVIRTFDFGADKFMPDKDQVEKNPFLGQRSIRWCFKNLPVFMDQLRAILRVSALGDVKIMLPMISSIGDFKLAKSYIQDAKDDLQRRDVAFREDIKIGIMVEVPSAALIADELAREVDFLSIGTNDLVQYTLAVDRVNELVADYYQPSNPSIFRLLLRVVEAGRRFGTPVSLCGEMSGHLLYTQLLMGLGLRDLSMAPARVPVIKDAVRKLRMRDAYRVAQEALKYSGAKEAEAHLEAEARKLVPNFGA